MKKKMFRSFCLISAGAAVASVLLCVWAFYSLLARQAQADLRAQCGIIAQAAQQARDSDKYLDSLRSLAAQTRVTLVDADGTVLLDTRGNPAQMENHAGREEIAAALATGQGESVRVSPTLGATTYYCALRLEDGRVLRVSAETSGVGSMVAAVALPLCFILAVVIAVCLWTASRFTRGMLRPVEKIGRSLESDGEELPEDYYEELAPFLTTIRRQKRELRQQLERLRQERDTIVDITGNMREGLVLIDKEKNILSVNPAALELLEAGNWNYTGNNILCLSREPLLKEGVDKALEGEGSDCLIRCGGRDCRLLVSPVLREETLAGAIVLIMDVTQQQKSERMRREFSANVSHELKTPLTAISGYAEVIQTGMAHTPGDIRDFAGRITKEAARLLGLIDDIIRLSSLDERQELPREEADLWEMCRNIAEGLAPAAQERGVALEVHGRSLPLMTVPPLLRELAANLMDNAVKYNREGGRVDVTVARDRETVLLTVTDTGIGIPAESLDRVFERFYRVDKSRSKQTGGTGLGLSIAKHIAEQLGGSINVESTLGEGSAFTVRLPYRPPEKQ